MSRTNPAQEVGRYVAELSAGDLPESAVRAVERCFVDTVGVAVAGAQEGAGPVAADVFTSLSGVEGPATVLRNGGTAPLHDAAFVNGIASHYLDFDDVMTGIHVHPSVTMIPGILAVAERIGASGEEAITAFIAGLEAQYYVAAPINPGHYERGWHATATYGTFGATAAVASLLDLTATETTHALNIAASMATGIKRNFGSMTKSLHVGHAGYAGVVAAHLAAAGYDATENAMVGKAGFYDLFRGQDDPAYDSFPSLEDGWVITDIGIATKKYPCCYFTHSAIEAATVLSREHDIEAGDVTRVTVTASQAAMDTLAYEWPDTGLEAKFSMYYTVASAIVRDRVELATFDDDAIDHAATAAVMDVVEFDVDPDLAYGSHASTVTIERSNGNIDERHHPEPPGTPSNPLSDEEIRDKFEMCADRALDDTAGHALYRSLNSLRKQPDLATLLGPLAPT